MLLIRLANQEVTVYVPCHEFSSLPETNPVTDLDGTAVKAGRSRVRFPMASLEFFIHKISSGRTVAPGSTQPLTGISLGR